MSSITLAFKSSKPEKKECKSYFMKLTNDWAISAKMHKATKNFFTP
jgi:hypothetical protein